MAEPAPRWVKVFAIVAGALILLFVLLHLTGVAGGNHGPGGHGGGAETSVVQDGDQMRSP